MNIENNAKKHNIWMFTTIILAVLFIVSLLSSGITGFALFNNSGTVGAKIVNLINKNVPGSNPQILDITTESGLYKVKLSIQGNNMFVYASKDGKLLFPQAISLEQETSQQSEQTIKSDKPDVDLFVMSYCPFGTQMEKGILPVVKLLKDKINFNIRFVYYAMHGEKEVNEELRQYCIQKEQNDKFLSYLECFLESGDSDKCLIQANIDKSKLDNCMELSDSEFSISENLNDQSKWLNGRFPLVNIDKELNERYNIRGSPTLIINGMQIQTNRDSASLLSAICSTFNNKPEECNTKLSSETPSPGFGFESSNSASSTGSCG
ncbi:MAG: hypothetical protein J7K26_01935 [Candidatus Aenigmarchaeota archaeon]|nr:hypothetical protein [Candidatus Aenigmarchaeota archaeon]